MSDCNSRAGLRLAVAPPIQEHHLQSFVAHILSPIRNADSYNPLPLNKERQGLLDFAPPKFHFPTSRMSAYVNLHTLSQLKSNYSATMMLIS